MRRTQFRIQKLVAFYVIDGLWRETLSQNIVERERTLQENATCRKGEDYGRILAVFWLKGRGKRA